MTTLEFEVLSLRHADSFYWLESRHFQEPENAHVYGGNSGLGISRMFRLSSSSCEAGAPERNWSPYREDGLPWKPSKCELAPETCLNSLLGLVVSQTNKFADRELNMALGEMKTVRFENTDQCNSDLHWRSMGG